LLFRYSLNDLVAEPQVPDFMKDATSA
jgi:hypothetical protein